MHFNKNNPTFIFFLIYILHKWAHCNGWQCKSLYSYTSLMVFILDSFPVSEFISDIIHALCINSTLTSLKLGENILGELFQVCVVKLLALPCEQSLLRSSKKMPIFSRTIKGDSVCRGSNLRRHIKTQEDELVRAQGHAMSQTDFK